MALDDSCAHGDALGARADGVGGVFNIGAGYEGRRGGGGRGVQEEGGADAEEGVWACITIL